MSTITDKAIAAEVVAARSAAENSPAVGIDEIKGGDEAPGLLDEAVLATVWASETQYAIGDRVIPTEENGLWYILLPGSNGNESGTTEPTWPEWQNGYVADNGLLWQLAGRAPEALWDLSLAVHLVWKRKTALAASLSDVGLDARDQFRRSQVFDHCQAMMEATAPFCV